MRKAKVVDLRKRVIVTLTPETFEALKSAAIGSGNSLGGLAGQFLEEARPILVGMAAVFEKTKEQRLDAFDDLHKVMTAAVVEGRQLSAEFGELARANRQLAETVQRRKARRAKG